ncbi:Uncharacterised protein [Vibrio cholerae]|nr:Uncharacterised protein [Vibrio cholerae]
MEMPKASEQKEFANVSLWAMPKHIRCGILHQAETTGGWRIRRKGELVDKNEKIINATKFMNALESELNAYLHKLEIEDFTDLVWVNLLKKIDFIASNAVGD